MKVISIQTRLPEKQDIIESWNSLTNEEIKRFVCDFEGIKNISEFRTKTIPTKKFGDVMQLQKVRKNESWEEFYSGKTVTVYRVSYYDEVMYFEQIYFKDNRHYGIGYGLDPDTAMAVAYCTKHNRIIPIQPNWLGNHFSECSKCWNENLERRKKQENYQG